MKIVAKLYLFILIMILTIGCKKQDDQNATISEEENEVFVHDWIRDKNIYEVNIRQYTPEGTFAAFEKEIPRLKEMGVDILYLMPIHEIGKINRKGTLGSYFSIKNHKSINHHFGNKDDFSRLVKAIHEQGMYIFIDWVANHTAWDHEWTHSHPEYYTKDEQGKFMPPVGTDWNDVIDLNYDKEEVHTAMAEAMLYWVKEFNVDGFRCDAAELVPISFWKRIRKDLNEIKPIFLMADGTHPDLYDAFDMTYSADMTHALIDLVGGLKSTYSLDSILQAESDFYPKKAKRMRFLSNHDVNSGLGPIDSLYGRGHAAMAVLMYTIPGMPMVYSGQESNLSQRLSFFEKDTIQWGNYENAAFYKSLNILKSQNEAIWNGSHGGEYRHLEISTSDVFVFKRTKDNSTVITVLNLSDKEQYFNYTDIMEGTKPYFMDNNVGLEIGTAIKLKPWAYQVYTK